MHPSVPALLCLALAGCASPRVEVLHAAGTCPGGADREVRWLSGPDELARLWRLGARQLPVPPVPVVDFASQVVVYVADRERPSAGHGLALAGASLSVTDRTARLTVRASAPAGPAAQVVTRPCLWLALTPGSYDRVEVLDPSGALWGSAARPAGSPAH